MDIGQIWVDLIFLVTSLPIQLYEQILLVPLVRSLVLKQDIDEDDEPEVPLNASPTLLPDNKPWEIPNNSSNACCFLCLFSSSART